MTKLQELCRKLRPIAAWPEVYGLGTSLFLAAIPLVLFWPGKITIDEIDKLKQIWGLSPWDNWHPLLTKWLYQTFTHTPSGTFYFFGFQTLMVTLLGLGALSLVIRTYADGLSLRRKRMIFAVVTPLLIWSPPSGLLNLVLWKDTLFTWASLLAVSSTMCLVQLAIQKRHGRLGSACIAMFGLSMVFVLHLRHNGISLALSLGLVSYIALFQQYRHSGGTFARSAAAKLLMASLLAWGIRFPLKTLAPAQTPVAMSSYSWQLGYALMHDLNVALIMGVPLTEAETRRLQEIIDIEKTKQTMKVYNSYYSNWPEYAGAPDREALVATAADILTGHPWYWFKAKLRYLFEIIKSRQGSQMPFGRYETLAQHGLPVKLDMDPSLQDAREFFWRLMGRDVDNLGTGIPFWKKFLFWTFFPYVILNLVLCGYVWVRYRQGRNYLSLLVPSLASISLSLPLVLLSQANCFRYHWLMVPASLLGFLVFVLTWWQDRQHRLRPG